MTMESIGDVTDRIEKKIESIRDSYIGCAIDDNTLRDYRNVVENTLRTAVPPHLSYTFECSWVPYYRYGEVLGYSLGTSFSLTEG